MNPVRLALAELRRLTSSRLARLGLIALAIIPTLYGGLYLYANHDPYAALPQVPAAVASDDTGATLSTGETLEVGDEVADHLVESGSFDWHKVSHAEALQGVHDGRYSFAVLLPATFSADLAATADFTPRQATVALETNDANNYMTTIMGNTVIKQVSASVASQVSQTAADRLLLGFNQVHDDLGKAVDGAGRLRDGIGTAEEGAARAAAGARSLASGLHDLASGAARLHDGVASAFSGAERLHSGATALASGLGTLEQRTATLPAQTDRLADGAAQVAGGNEKIAGLGRTVAGVSSDLKGDLRSQREVLLDELRSAGLDDAQIALVESRLDRVDGLVDTADGRIQKASDELDHLSAGADQVATGARALAEATPALTDGIGEAATGARRLRDGSATLESGLGRLVAGSAQLEAGATRAASGGDSLATGVAQLEDGVHRLASGAGRLHSELARGRAAVPNPTDAQRTATARTIGDPVDVTSSSMAAAGTYGAGLAPLFLSLALWIGAYTLFLLVRPFSTRALATSQRSLRTALGGWLAPVAVGLAQTVALYLVVSLALGIRVAHPVLALLFLGFVSMTFVAILHALAARLGAVGKFIGLVFMVVQLVSAGGTFPWQTLPGPLQAIHHVVPMTYAIDGLRRLMYGAGLSPVVGDLGVLTAYLVGALAVATVAARRSRVWTPARIKPELSL
ncbi:YhgE/Pip domain-containing protein [Terrabacter sp. MAHUQ-38]|uniref:YhgE/Pip domain-containing protein n=1 Tax=unclassified Terrabacter TaxID=2630222 RepID=UPI00165DFFF5|nr:YhgE/Pip domain-containing protein [Terrabacter sp. MAHUQ-38]MBC9821569.1 YhgE/Pip domain-containing protein [Terrabacter sp. MAHUQ-38]